VDKIVDPLKNSIDLLILVFSLPPSFDNARVVSMDEDMAANIRERGKSVYEELESDCFHPSNIPLAIARLPAWY
jgi:hypothetical protein